jgi:hypothetical protein
MDRQFHNFSECEAAIKRARAVSTGKRELVAQENKRFAV